MSYIIYKRHSVLHLVLSDDAAEYYTDLSLPDLPKASLLESPSGKCFEHILNRVLLIGDEFEVKHAKRIVLDFTETGDSRFIALLAKHVNNSNCTALLFTGQRVLFPQDHVAGGRTTPDYPWASTCIPEGFVYGARNRFNSLITALDATEKYQASFNEVVEGIKNYGLLGFEYVVDVLLDEVTPLEASQ